MTSETQQVQRPALFADDWGQPVWFDDGQPMNQEAEYIEDMELYAQFLEARLARLEAALPDATKLDLLADWIDLKYPNDSDPEVQNDLRAWARNIRAALEPAILKGG